MGRRKGTSNKTEPVSLPSLTLSVDERIQYIASLIVDSISADQHAGAGGDTRFSERAGVRANS